MTKQLIRGEIILDDIVIQSAYSTLISDYCLVVDTETYTNISQKCKIAMFSLFNLKEASSNPHDIKYESTGIVSYDLSPNELEILKQYCIQHKLKLLSRDSFITRVLYPCLEKGVLLANHVIPFDIGALCSDFAVLPDTNQFEFKLCYCEETPQTIHTHEKITIPCSLHPTIIVQYLKSHKYLIYVNSDNYAPIVDTLTLGDALLGKTNSSSLNGMLRRYGLKDDKKKEIETYSGEYNEQFYEYAMHDVYLTSMLIASEYSIYLKHNIDRPFHTVMSEASIGKAYLDKLGIPPFKQTHKEVKPFMYNLAHIAFYGARSEVSIRLKPTQVLYTDFKSQYPFVCALLNTQKYLLAEYVYIHHCIELAQDIINTITLDDLQNKETWLMLPILVKINTYGHIIPIRFMVDKSRTYGECISTDTNHTSWYSLLDVIASKIRTGNIPTILDAYRLIPKGHITTNELDIFSNPDYHVDLKHDDFFVKVVDLRDTVNAEIKKTEKELQQSPTDELYSKLNLNTNLKLALKLMANSTSYGILVESREVKKQDIAGKYNSLPVGVHITSGARLLLAIAEKLGKDRGIEHGLCDTDSFAYALPDDMSFEIFYAKVLECINWFTPLSPYAKQDAIFELESYNYVNGELTPLYLYGVSPKRYVLYNKHEGIYTIRKLSEHAMTSYSTDIEVSLPDDIADIPRNETDTRIYKPDRYCLWYRAIQYAENNSTPYVPSEVWSNQLALEQKTISSPRIYSYHKYIAEIRPFSFFTVTPLSKNKKNKHRYYMPYTRTGKEIYEYLQLGMIREIKTNVVVSEIYIDTIQDRLSNFFSHIENKFSNGNDIGTMNRRELGIIEIKQITRSGKSISFSTVNSLWGTEE